MDVVEDVPGDVLAADMRDWTWCLRSRSSFSISGSLVESEAVRDTVGELTVDWWVRLLPDAADAYEYICFVSIFSGIFV